MKNINSEMNPNIAAIQAPQSVAAVSDLLAIAPMVRATNGYEKLSISRFQTQLGIIVSKMAGNVNFPTLQMQTDELKIDSESFNSLVVLAAGGGKTAIINRDQKRVAITDKLHALGMAVSTVCNGDTAKFSSSGIKYTEPRKPSPPLVQPMPPMLKRSTTIGQIKVVSKRQKGITSVVFMITANPAGEWIQHPGNRVSATFDNLVRGQMYHIKVMFTGTKNQKVMSEAITAYAA